ncbi:hypothetical protein BAUCODRAFT_72155 [Baudoinia panamericana UAMH 10762]|uniref:BAH domain-containing protein n=1 Tax=Baudoinia panamericana (strain UAMH 10762) TaxID=717646 RepID=M2N834_BAUPA|nr:uncharacterized protein BAUCODRAFT_72155 [Baudoinia panamericana UAMH 10762]EMC95259.1 hypothetical protein BAUCODRAFT_72155 [Baudoinia panamericana UAMH 10762]
MASAEMRSPLQPHDLSKEDRERLKDYLDTSDKPFSVETQPLNRKRKRAGTPLPIQEGLFEERLNVRYKVKPMNNWESLRKYKKFTVGNESIGTGECILVKHDAAESQSIDVAAQWKAKVLDIKAFDQEHVYLRVAWLNRPEDLDTGRKAYHGKNELIPTNQLDVIDAMTVNGRLDVYHWEEADDDSQMPDPDEHFWRQTYDFVTTKTFSALRLICTDRAPQNPDEMIVQCSNTDCRKWMHLRCIAEDAVSRAADGSPPKKKKNGKRKSKADNVVLTAESPALAAAWKGSFTALVYVKGEPKDAGEKRAASTKIVIRDVDEDQEEELDVRCLFCHSIVND